MAADATIELQKAIVTAVAADSALGALGIDTVFDHVPDHVLTDNYEPYCSFGPSSAEAWNTNGVLGQETVIQIDTWSRERGRVVLAQVMRAMRDLLERSTLTVTGQAFVGCWFELGQIMRDPDGVSMHGVQQFRFVTHE